MLSAPLVSPSAYGQKCHICGGDEQRENNISSKIKYNYKRIFLLSVTIIGFLGILGLLQFCNSRDRKEKSLYESAIDTAINNNVPEAIDKLCKLPESSQYFNVAQSWIQKWNEDKYWHEYVKPYLEKQGSSCPVGNAVLQK